ncbi:hypothetical protein HK101_006816 [Irineochytrium annulatum]|nr:hypothetical protein HK101_006816 [Irineochytrium annulatum]
MDASAFWATAAASPPQQQTGNGGPHDGSVVASAPFPTPPLTNAMALQAAQMRLQSAASSSHPPPGLVPPGMAAGMDFQEMVEAAKAAAAVAEKMQAYVGWQLIHQQQIQQQAQQQHDALSQQNFMRQVSNFSRGGPASPMSNESPVATTTSMQALMMFTNHEEEMAMSEYFGTAPPATMPATFNGSAGGRPSNTSNNSAYSYLEAMGPDTPLTMEHILDTSMYTGAPSIAGATVNSPSFHDPSTASSSNGSPSPSSPPPSSTTTSSPALPCLEDPSGVAARKEVEAMDLSSHDLARSTLSMMPQLPQVPQNLQLPASIIPKASSADPAKKKRGRPAGKRDALGKTKKALVAANAVAAAAKMRMAVAASQAAQKSAAAAEPAYSIASVEKIYSYDIGADKPLPTGPPPLSVIPAEYRPRENIPVSTGSGVESKVPIVRLPKTPLVTMPVNPVPEKPPKQQRKVAHNAIERRYRNNINQRIADLKIVVPALNSPKIKDGRRGGGAKKDKDGDDDDSDGDGGDDQDEIIDGIPAATKHNKATILRKATEYIVHLRNEVARHRDESAALRHLLLHNFNVDVDAYLINGKADPNVIAERAGLSLEAAAAYQRAKQNKLNVGGPGTPSVSPPPSSPELSAIQQDAGAGSGIQQGARMMAFMFMTASALYIPSPFDGAEAEDGGHEYMTGKVLFRRNGAAEADGSTYMLAFGAGAMWAGVKFAVVTFGLISILSALLSVMSIGSRYTTRRKQAAGAKAAESAVESLAENWAILTGRKVSGSLGELGFQGGRFMSNYVLGLGVVLEELLHSKQRRRWHAKASRVGLDFLEALMAKPSFEANPVAQINTALSLMSTVALAGPYLPVATRLKITMTCALALRQSINANSGMTPRIVSILQPVSVHLWRTGIDLAQRCTPESTTDAGVKFIMMEAATDAGRSMLLERFIMASEHTTLDAFAKKQRAAAIVRDMVKGSSAVLCLPTGLGQKKLPPVSISFEKMMRDAEVAHDIASLWSGAAGTVLTGWVNEQRLIVSPPGCADGASRPASAVLGEDRAALDVAIRAWLQVEKREAISEALIGGETDGTAIGASRKLTSLALLAASMARSGDYAVALRAVQAMDGLIREGKGLLRKAHLGEEEVEIAEEERDLAALLEFGALACCLDAAQRFGAGKKRLGGVSRRVVAHMRRLLPILARKGGRDGAPFIDCVRDWSEAVACL